MRVNTCCSSAPNRNTYATGDALRLERTTCDSLPAATYAARGLMLFSANGPETHVSTVLADAAGNLLITDSTTNLGARRSVPGAQAPRSWWSILTAASTWPPATAARITWGWPASRMRTSAFTWWEPIRGPRSSTPPWGPRAGHPNQGSAARPGRHVVLDIAVPEGGIGLALLHLHRNAHRYALGCPGMDLAQLFTGRGENLLAGRRRVAWSRPSPTFTDR